MRTSLHYFYKVQKGNEPNPEMGVGIIPFVYNEAYNYYVDLMKIKKSVQNFDLEEAQKNIIIRVQKKNPHNYDEYKGNSIIDISTL